VLDKIYIVCVCVLTENVRWTKCAHLPCLPPH